MQIQAYAGYWENERFYPTEKPVRKTGRQRAILTFIDEPHNDEVITTQQWPDFINEMLGVIPDDGYTVKMARQDRRQL